MYRLFVDIFCLKRVAFEATSAISYILNPKGIDTQEYDDEFEHDNQGQQGENATERRRPDDSEKDGDASKRRTDFHNSATKMQIAALFESNVSAQPQSPMFQLPRVAGAPETECLYWTEHQEQVVALEIAQTIRVLTIFVTRVIINEKSTIFKARKNAKKQK